MTGAHTAGRPALADALEGELAGLGYTWMYRVGKKKAGRLLDGSTWNQFPLHPERHATAEKATAITEPARPEFDPSTSSGDVPSNGSSSFSLVSSPTADGEAAANDGAAAVFAGGPV
jgi:hypothetical protein